MKKIFEELGVDQTAFNKLRPDRIVQSSSSFFKQPSAVTRYMQRSKQPPVVKKFSGDVPFELCFERNQGLPLALSYGEDRGGWLLDAICQHTCADDACNCNTWAAPHNKDFLIKKRTKTSLHKTISEKKSSPCRGMVQCMNAHWLTKYTNKTCHAHSDMHSITWPHLFNNHPYISSSGTPVGMH